MRLPFLSMFITSPFNGLQEHAEKITECAWAFQQAIECHVSKECQRFEKFRQDVIVLEREADNIKRRIRGHLPKGTMLPVDKFELFRYLGEQDKVLDTLEDVLDWISFRTDPGIPDMLHKEFLIFVDEVMDPVEELPKMVAAARKYFQTFSEKDRIAVKEIIKRLRRQEHDADEHEAMIKQKVFSIGGDGITVFHMVRLAETIGAIADHAENAGDMMRAMIAK